MAAENFKVKKGLEVGTGATITSEGVNVTGIITATQFKGDGSGLTGVVGSGSGIVVKDEGSAVGTAGTVNFVGSGVAATLSAGTATVTINAGGLDNVVEDTTPQLGGNLDLNSKFVTGSGGINVTGVVTATTLKGNGDFVDIDVDGQTELDDLNVAGVSTFSDNVIIPDNKKLILGTQTGRQLHLYHNMVGSSNHIIESTSSSNHLILKATTINPRSDYFSFRNYAHNQDVFIIDADGQTKLFFNGNEKLTTTINGIEVPDLNVTGVGTIGRMETSGVTLGTNNNTFAAKFIDDAVANFGTDNDLKISHDDTHARITNTKGNIVVSGIISATSDVKVGSAITMDPTSGIITATSFSGSGSGLTSIPSAQLSGALPALDGSALTGITASGSGIIVKHDGSTVGTAGTINFSTNLDVSAISAGIVTVTASGGGAGISTDAQGNTFGGALAGNALTSNNDDNVIIGREAGEALNSGDDNVFIGAHAGEAATSISDSVFIGYKSGFEGQTGSRNVIIGNGNFSIYSNNQLQKCTFVGYNAGSSMQNSHNEYNTYIGYQAGLFAGADFDVAIGKEAGSRSTGKYGVFIGEKAGNESGTPSDVTGQENVMIGRQAGKVYTSGGDNTLVGSQCGATLTTGSNNLILGHDADVSGATVSNEITLGDANITKLRVPGIGLTFTSVGAEISGIVTATTFSGSGASLTTLNASELDSGTIPNGRFPATLPAVSGANLTALNATEITSGTLPIARIDNDAVTFAKMQNVGTGVLIGRNDSGTGDIETLTAAEARTLLNVADGATAGITTAAWTVGHSGASYYTFTGPGGLSNAQNADIHLVRGQTYQFIVNASGHGFGIQTVSGTWTGSNAYTTGITNAGAAVGTITFRVPYSAPARLYYACTSQHSGMVGNIFCRGAGGSDDKVGITTITGGFLHIKDNTSPAIRLQDNNNVNSDFKIYSPDGANHLRIYHENTSSDLVTIASGGNVGIGTDNPNKELEIHGGSDTCLRVISTAGGVASLQLGDTSDHIKGAITFKNDDNTLRIRGHNNDDRIIITSTGRIDILGDSGNAGFTLSNAYGQAGFFGGMYYDGSSWIRNAIGTRKGAGLYINTGGHFGFLTSPETSGTSATMSQIMQVWNGGRVAIGDETTTAHAGYLQVIHNGGGNQTADTLVHFETNANDWVMQLENDEGAGTAHFVYFKKDGNNPGSITSSNTSTNYNTTGSDRELKKNFESWTEDTLSLFKNINPQKFNFKIEDNSAEKTKGFIAQDMLDKFPEAYPKDRDGYYKFNPSGMVAYLMKALQEEIVKREALEARISALEGS